MTIEEGFLVKKEVTDMLRDTNSGKMLRKLKRAKNKISSRIFRENTELQYRIGLSAIAASRANYQNILRLEQADLKVYSQYGEDGIIDFIMERLGISKPTFIEIGTEDYSESNTRFLFQRTSTKGLIIDGDPALTTKSRRVLGDYYWKGDLTALSAFVTRENIKKLLCEYSDDWVNHDLFSLDIDGNDYWIMKEIIHLCRSKLIILEYNPYFGSSARVSVPYQEDFFRTDYHHSNLCWGASLGAFTELLSNNNYIFAGTNINNSNAFWVRADLFQALGIKAPATADLSAYTQNHCRESRNRAGELDFLAGKDRLREIKDCMLVNLDNQEALQSISEIFSIET